MLSTDRFTCHQIGVILQHALVAVAVVAPTTIFCSQFHAEPAPAGLVDSLADNPLGAEFSCDALRAEIVDKSPGIEHRIICQPAAHIRDLAPSQPRRVAGC